MKPDFEYRPKKTAKKFTSANTGTRIEKGGYVPVGSDDPRSPPKGSAVVKSNPTSAQLARLAELEAKEANRKEQVKKAVRKFRAKKKQTNGEPKCS
jgi:hypothetical protein